MTYRKSLTHYPRRSLNVKTRLQPLRQTLPSFRVTSWKQFVIDIPLHIPIPSCQSLKDDTIVTATHTHLHQCINPQLFLFHLTLRLENSAPVAKKLRYDVSHFGLGGGDVVRVLDYVVDTGRGEGNGGGEGVKD
jgi:hypothetical protein